MSHTRILSPSALTDYVGEPLGVSDWHTITQQQVNLFADATGDHQWLHVDPERAATGPFGTTIAHGYLTLSLAPLFIAETLIIDEVKATLNYGANRVRFPAPVPVGSRIRGTVGLTAVAPRSSGLEATLALVCEIEGSERPAYVAELVILYQ